MAIETLGIIGAGKMGMVLAQLALNAGYKVLISGSGSADKIRLSTTVLAPGAVAITNQTVATDADAVILALPLSKVWQLSPKYFDRKLVVDATNYWWEVDGPRIEILSDTLSSSEAIQQFLKGSRVVKSLSHMGYHDLHDEAKSGSMAGRKALAVAGDRDEDVEIVSGIIERLGFDALFVGDLRAGKRLEPGSPAFGANLSKAALYKLLSSGS